MPESAKLNFRSVELDSDMLKIPFRIQTNWHVITGAPSSGKTTLINLLANNGYRISQEGARLFLEREIARGHTLEEMRSNQIKLQHRMKDMQVKIEQRMRPNDQIFLDRAIPDYLAWYRVFGLDPNEFLEECFYFRYASVFILDPLPLRHNGLRYKDAKLQSFTDEWHTRDYTALGYHITRVAVMPPEERLEFVLQTLSEQKLI